MPSEAPRSEHTDTPVAPERSCSLPEPASADDSPAARVAASRASVRSRARAGNGSASAVNVSEETRKLRSVKKLLAAGRRKGFLTVDDVSGALPDRIINAVCASYALTS